MLVDGKEMSWMDWIKKWEAERIFKKKNNVRHVKTLTLPLPKEAHHKCPSCNGTKSYYMEGDLHKSGGIVPCYRCDADGMITTYEKKVYRVNARTSTDG